MKKNGGKKIKDGMYLVSYVANYQHLSTTTRRKPKSHEEKPQTGCATLTTGRGGHLGQPVVVAFPGALLGRYILYLFLSACCLCRVILGLFW